MLRSRPLEGSRHARQQAGDQHLQVWFGRPDRPLFGWAGIPAGARARGAVLLCPPMGEEGRSAHRTFRRLAEELTSAGLLTLRFDYDGTGDSAGGQEDEDRVGQWLDSIAQARSFLVELGAPAVAAVGMRLGATLAASFAASFSAPFSAPFSGPAPSAGGEPFDSLVLWDPCESGRTFLREGEALHRFSEGTQALGVPADGRRHTPGFQYDAATAAALRELDLGRLGDDQRLAGRVLLLTREDRPVSARVGARMQAQQAAGVDLARGPASGQELLVDVPPLDAQVPQGTLAQVTQWLSAGWAGAESVPVGVPGADREVHLPAAGPGSPVIVERAVRLGWTRLFGMVSDVPQPPPGRRPWVVLVNVATEHHIGPGRRWVELAREWASAGFRCVRIDLTGVGDSPTDRSGVEDVVFDPRWMHDFTDALRDLSRDGSPVVLFGLCSGAYSAFESALRTEVAAVYAINPGLTLWPAMRGTGGFKRGRRAGITPWSWLNVVGGRKPWMASALWRAWRQVVPFHAPGLVLWRVTRRGTRVRVIAAPDDAHHLTEVVALMPLIWLMRWSSTLEFRRHDRLDHSLLGRGPQEIVRADATAFLNRHRAEWERGPG